MRRKTIVGLAFGLAAVLVFGGLYASNMGFKLNSAFGAAKGAKVGTGTDIIALPFNQQTDLLDAKDLIDDVETSTGIPGVVIQVGRYLIDSDGFAGYTGTSGAAFALVPGEAYLLQVDPTANVNYISVGSHDPDLVITLLGPSPGVSASGSNLYAYPFHSVATDAKELIDEVNAAAGSPVVVQVAEYLTETDGFAGYTGTSGVAFPLNAGTGYLIQVSTDVSFVPAHY